MSDERCVVFCRCAYSDRVPAAAKEQVRQALAASGVAFEVVDDLCGLAGRREAVLARWAAAEKLQIVACHPRAVKWLFHAGGAPLDDGRVEVLNMKTQAPGEILRALLGDAAGDEQAADATGEAAAAGETVPAEEPADGWIPWFPVIDYDRCAGCRQCANFCLFGAFSIEDDRVVVSNPDKCKTNCPACARVCPQAAIIFPKYPDEPFNGAEVDEQARRQQSSADLDKQLRADAYAVLRGRGKAPREAPAGPPSAADLARMAKDLEIPPGVLESLAAPGGGDADEAPAPPCCQDRPCCGGQTEQPSGP